MNIHSEEGQFKQIQTITKVYHDKYMFTRLKQALRIRKTNLEVEKSDKIEKIYIPPTPEQDEENKARSMRRTQKTISDLIDSNDFELFPTFTFNPAHIDVKDDEAVKKKFIQWIKNAQKKQFRLYGDNFAYVIVPERHKSGVLHFHGVFHNYRLEIYDTGFKDRSKRKIYKLRDYDKIGFSNTTKIGDKAKTANYVKKYITKELSETEAGKKRYWASKGLKMPDRVDDLHLAQVLAQPSAQKEDATMWENEYCEIWTIPRKKNVIDKPLLSPQNNHDSVKPWQKNASVSPYKTEASA